MSDVIPEEAPPARAPTPVELELAAMREARAKVATRRAEIDAAKAASEVDPATLLAEEKIAFARERREADIAEHELAADGIYRAACIEYGDDRVMRVRNRCGSIVLRAQTEAEVRAFDARSAGHAAPASATKAEKAQAENNAEEARRAALLPTVLTDHKHFTKITAANPLLWAAIWRARNTLIDAREVEEGKGAAH